jgi:hypothetical protein
MSWSLRWVAVGAVGALIADVAARRRADRYRLSLHSIGLVGAAAIYPALHSGPGADRAERQREIVGLAACTALVVAAPASRSRSRLLAAGWAAHALFDAVHHRSESSLLPDWYPAACAGYDVALAVALAVPASPYTAS